MTLNDIFDQLSYGELSQVFAGNSEDGIMNAPDWPKIGASVALGLTELHKRFLLKERTVRIDLVENQQSYVLNNKFAESNTASTETNKYIKDTSDPFLNDVLKVERIYNDEGDELVLNVIDDENSIRTTSPTTLLLPAELDTDYIEVVYRADHPALDRIMVASDPTQVTIDLPITHLEPLLLFVASRVLNPVGISGEFHEGNNYWAKFEGACARLTQTGNDQINTQGENSRLERNGWV